MILRDAREEELPTLRALILRAYEEYARIMAPSAWAGLEQAIHAALRFERSDVQRIVAVLEGGELAGGVLLYPPAIDAYGGAVPQMNWPELRLLSVAPEARGQGVGQKLLDECIRRARASGAEYLGLHTSKSMQAALHLYARNGFVRCPDYDFQPPGAELVEAYRLPLKDASTS